LENECIDSPTEVWNQLDVSHPVYPLRTLKVSSKNLIGAFCNKERKKNRSALGQEP
jgi:hypothetical protein